MCMVLVRSWPFVIASKVISRSLDSLYWGARASWRLRAEYAVAGRVSLNAVSMATAAQAVPVGFFHPGVTRGFLPVADVTLHMDDLTEERPDRGPRARDVFLKSPDLSR